MKMLSRRSLLTAGLGLVAGCSTTKTFAGREGTGPTAAPNGEIIPPGVPLDEPITSIAMVGDSITDGSSSALRDAFAAAGINDVVIDGEASRRIDVASNRNGIGVSGVNAVKALLENGADPTVWVIALGTNDVGSFGTAEECAELIEKITTLLPPPVHMVWVNVYRPSDMRDTQVFNDVLAEVIEARGAAVIADWYAIASDPNQEVLRNDDVHPNDAGKVAFAQVVVQALQRL